MHYFFQVWDINFFHATQIIGRELFLFQYQPIYTPEVVYGSGGMIKVDSQTSREDIRRGLNDFSFFSEIEVKRNYQEGEVFYIKEVGLLEQLSRIFKTREKIKKRDLDSKKALMEMTLSHPNIAGMLGRSVIAKSNWTAREFRQGIDLKKMPLRSLVEGKKPIPEDKNLLITEAPLNEVQNFPQVHVGFSNDATSNGENKFFFLPNNYAVHVVTRWNTAKDDLKPLYLAVMNYSEGPLAMELVPDRDYSKGIADRISDENIDAFLEALDEFEENQRDQSKKRPIVLSTDRDARLYHRIIDRKLAHDAVKKSKSANGKLTANDLLKLPAAKQIPENQHTTSADEFIHLAIGDEGLESTQWGQVHLLKTDCPAYVPSDRSMISLRTLASSKQPDGAAAPIAALARGLQDTADKFQWNQDIKEPVFKTIELPVDGLLMPELTGFVDNLEVDQYTYQGVPANKYKNFYKNFLKNSKGTVVLECPSTSAGSTGLRAALNELEKEQSLPEKLVLVASEADFPMAEIRLGKVNSPSETN
ncbi:MAG: hypothetical protein RI928_1021 [Pseudomonadota bacterium]|jgi:hypothetical protein